MIAQDTPTQTAGSPAFHGLPHEPGSKAELLSATHLFAVTLLKLEEGKWTRRVEEALDARPLRMEVRLVEPLKGALAAQPGATFSLSVEQRRQSKYATDEFMGLWSELEPRQGATYLVVSELPGVADERPVDPAEPMKEPALKALLPADRLDEVKLALEAERLYVDTLRASKATGPKLLADAARKLIDLAQKNRTRGRDLFARYLFVRLKPAIARPEERPLGELLLVLGNHEAQTEFRAALAADLFDAALFYETDRDLRCEIAHGLVLLLDEPWNERIHRPLIDIQLRNLLLDEDGIPVLRAADVVPDAGERSRLRQALAASDAEEAPVIARWLEAP